MLATRAENFDLEDDELWAQSKHYAHGGALKFDSIDGGGFGLFRSLRKSEATDQCYVDLLERLQCLSALDSGSVQGAGPTAGAVGASKVDATTTNALGFPLLCVRLRPTRVLSSRWPLGSSTSSTSSTGDFAEPSQEDSLSVDLKERLWSCSFRTWTNKCK